MKRFFTITLLLLSMIFFAACSSSKKEQNDSDLTTDTETNDADNQDNNDNEDNEEEDSDCTGISMDWSNSTSYYGNYYASVTLGDESLEDNLTLGIFQNNEDGSNVAIGEYDLGKGANTNYATCTECVLVGQDYIEPKDEDENGRYTKQYFQKKGTLKIEETDKDGNIKGTLAATLIEVTINEEDYTSTPVEGGACLEIETASFDTGICVPQCEEGWECGNDGCGGMCGGGCDGKACSAEHKCVAFACDKLEVGEFQLGSLDYFGIYTFYYYEALTTKEIGDQSIPDMLEIDLNTEQLTTGTITLTGNTENIGDAYVFLYEDYDEDNQSIGRTYFQESGTLNFTEVKEGTMESKGNGSFRVVEVDEDYVPAAGGKCYEFEKIEWDTVCVPDCEGKICGPDGCGGTCGEGCGTDKTCNAEQTACVDFSCTEITLDTNAGTYTPDTYVDMYTTIYTPFTGEEDLTDKFLIQLYDDAEGEQELYNTNYEDCYVCLLVFEDMTEDGKRNKEYFQQKGKITFSTSGTNVTATLSDVRLVEVEIDWTGNFTSIPVLDGSCLEIKDTTITYSID